MEKGLIVGRDGTERNVRDKREKHKEEVIFRFSLNGIEIESEKAAVALTWLQIIRFLIQANFYLGCMLADKERT